MADLASSIKDAIATMDPEAVATVLNHPDASHPAVRDGVNNMLNTLNKLSNNSLPKQDVLSDQAGAKAAGVDTIAHPDNSSSGNSPTTSDTSEELAKLQAIQDLATEASTPKATSAPHSLNEGNPFTDMLMSLVPSAMKAGGAVVIVHHPTKH
jgi:hypothetical protein